MIWNKLETVVAGARTMRIVNETDHLTIWGHFRAGTGRRRAARYFDKNVRVPTKITSAQENGK